ncbi:MAG: hypothetical protein M3342_24650 [Bacteroidota bacterium]|nr:hypothetical protein [Bacteroidota bacterium]
MKTLIKPFVLPVFCLFAVFTGYTNNPPELVCFSLKSAKRIIGTEGKNGLIDSVGFISTVWAVVWDSINNDVIIVGERNASSLRSSAKAKPSLFFDDVIFSLRCMDSVSTLNNPGVSIEPINKYRYNSYQKVIYFGDVANKHVGMIYATSDLLLKRLSLGLEKTSIKGFPSEWDLMINNEKAGRLYKPWEETLGRSYFFPSKVRIANNNGCAVLLSINIKVLSDDEKAAKFPNGSLGLSYKRIKEILDRNPDAASAVYARLFTEYLDSLVEQYPQPLHSLLNVMALPGLFQAVFRSDSSILSQKWKDDYTFWKKVYQITPYPTPDKVKTLSRTVNGVKYGTSVSGGIFSETEYVNDPWTELVLSKDPVLLKEAVLKSRPDTGCLVWKIPLGYGGPAEWSQALKDSMNNGLRNDSSSKTSNQSPAFDLFTVHSARKQKTYSSGWKTKLDGKNLVELKSSLLFSYGGLESLSPSRKYPIRGTRYSLGSYSVYNSDVTFGAVNGLEYSLFNKISFGIDIPVTLKLFTLDIPAGLPGLSENVMAISGGVQNPVLTAKIQVYDGIRKGRFKYPSLLLEHSLELPVYKRLFEVFVLGKEYSQSGVFAFGSDAVFSSHSMSSTVPIGSSAFIALSSSLQLEWNDTATIPKTADLFGSLRMTIQKKMGILMALNYGRYGSATNIGQIFSASVLFPGKGDYSTITFGYFKPYFSIDSRGKFFINFNLSGVRLFNKRFCF